MPEQIWRRQDDGGGTCDFTPINVNDFGNPRCSGEGKVCYEGNWEGTSLEAHRWTWVSIAICWCCRLHGHSKTTMIHHYGNIYFLTVRSNTYFRDIFHWISFIRLCLVFFTELSTFSNLKLWSLSPNSYYSLLSHSVFWMLQRLILSQIYLLTRKTYWWAKLYHISDAHSSIERACLSL